MIFENLEIEQALIGRMLSSEPEVLAELDYAQDDFSDHLHWQLYTDIRNGKRLRDYALAEQGTYAYVAALRDAWGLPLRPGGDDYQKILRELATNRRIYRAICETKEKMEAAAPPSSETMGFLNKMINENAQAPQIKSRSQVRAEIIRALELPKACYATPLKKLNTALGGGFYEGFTYGLCGKEKAGKTTLAHSISDRLDCPHLYLALEMGAAQIEQKNVAGDIGINSLAFLDRPDDLGERTAALPARDNVFYLDAPGMALDEIIQNIGLAKIKHRIKGFILDYWQLVGGQQRGESEEKHLRNVAQGLADYARKNALWCVILAQQNKDGQLFGGNGLRKACDQLYMIETCGDHITYGRWLKMDASRYTFREDVGSENNPCFVLNVKQGPRFEDM